MRDAVVAALAEATSRLRRRPRHVVVKSVNSVFSLDWIVKRYTPKVLVLRRNPLNVVSSWVVLNLGTERRIGDHPLVADERCDRTSSIRPYRLIRQGHNSRIELQLQHAHSNDIGPCVGNDVPFSRDLEDSKWCSGTFSGFNLYNCLADLGIKRQHPQRHRQHPQRHRLSIRFQSTLADLSVAAQLAKCLAAAQCATSRFALM